MRFFILWVAVCVHVGQSDVPIVSRWDVFSTKTLYRWAHDTTRPNPNSDYVISYNNGTCRAAHVNMVIRHGARFPTKGSIADVHELVEKLKRNKRIDLYPEIDSWVSPYHADLESMLNSEGVLEQSALGQRTYTRYQRLFDLNGDSASFVSTNKQRTKASANSFYNGAYNTSGGCLVRETECVNPLKKPLPSLIIDDHRLRYYDSCESFESETLNNKTNMAEFSNYETTADFINIIQSIKSNLGINESVGLNADDVYTLYDLCAYDQYTLNPNMPPVWCRLLSDAQREVLEYGQDIETWYENMYSQPINSVLACPLVRSMFEHLEASMNDSWNYNQTILDNRYKAAVFQFAHSETVATLMAALGLYKDTRPLLATNRAAMTNRLFKTSTLLPYSSNLAFVLYACDVNRNDVNSTRVFLLQLFVNERVVRIPGCSTDACPFEVVRQRYAGLINNCNIKDICDDDENDTSGASTIFINLTGGAFVFFLGSIIIIL
ncbi:multiple inositol polyphosphate phosphatase 1-like isoform X1 [Dreissena polymorpha]|uniref:multiple inositol polyphosphate phosphatase 1-like isoform X1 n=1 Tax=Dreissena polymorpha TaxID=45954 RepID=UPI002264C7EC|nr:multiple inositol polyphosphate phosphatase 1-like isoform X1 [Dreissena polymorpha]